MTLIGLGAVACVAMVAFIRSNKPINKLAVMLVFAVSAVYSMGVTL